ncbi:MAG: AAA family ATPase [Gammaproteobacteria bacterium]|nr:MAG: AAA family ATPase [Gammaproteobacteria bacterium]
MALKTHPRSRAVAPAVELQSLVDSHERPFVVIDEHYRVLALNKAYERAYGIPAEKARTGCCYEVSHGRSRPCHEAGEDCPHLRVFRRRTRYTCLHVHYDEQGRPHRVRITAMPLVTADGRLLMGETIEDLDPHQADCGPGQAAMAGKSPAFLRCMDELLTAARTEAPVLLQGETGTGKEMAAAFLHRMSGRAAHPFLILDCTVLTESLFEAEVFGHTRDAFTGSTTDKPGLVEQADGGTLFLDEIGEMPLGLQAKLLRFLETGEYRRVGDRRLRRADVRIVCATNRDLQQAVRAGRFREDLYYRIACLTIHLPPLRDRKEDIPLLAEALLARMKHVSGETYRIDPQAQRLLARHDYPGNIRELRNLLFVAASLARDGVIDAEILERALERTRHPSARQPGQPDARPQEERAATEAPSPEPGPPTGAGELPPLEAMEARYLQALLEKHGGNRRKVAAEMGISERTLYRKLKKYGLRD